MQYLGTHVSTAGGVAQAPLRAKEIGCNTIQFFAKNNNQWLAKKPLSEEEVEAYHRNHKECGVAVAFSHAGYLINLACPNKKNHDLSMQSLQQELELAQVLKLDFVVLHPGAHLESGLKEGIWKIAESLNKIFGAFALLHPVLLLETTAGQGTSIGYRFEHLAAIIDLVSAKERVGVCLDTCHVFAAGYDFRSPQNYEKMWKEFDSALGLSRLKAIHLNDSKQELASRVDRHEHIGKGKIGESGFRLLMQDPRLAQTPMVLETPKQDDFVKYDRRNLELLRCLALTAT